MKYICNEIIVVEGTGDATYLSSFIDAEYVITNGFDVKNDIIEYLNQAIKFKRVIILTDPDESGRKIRTKLNQNINNCVNIEVSIERCDKNGKHGVAECDKQEIIDKLQNFFSLEKIENNDAFDKNIIKLIKGKNKKVQLCKTFKIGVCNTKTIIKRLQTLHITQEQIEKVLGENHGS